MGSLIKWEFKKTIFSKSFMGIGIILFLSTFGSMMSMGSDQAHTGFEIFISMCNNFNSFILFFVGIFAGVTVTRSFEERQIQSAVMAGYSRLKIISVKLMSFSLSIALFWLFTATAGTVIISSTVGLSGVPGSFIREVIMRILVYCLVLISSSSICFLISCAVQNMGAAIAANLVSMLFLNVAAEFLLGEKWAEVPMGLTAVGQTMMTLADSSTANYLLASVSSLIGLGGVLLITYEMFRRMELK